MPKKWIPYPEDSLVEDTDWIEELNQPLRKQREKMWHQSELEPFLYLLAIRKGVRGALLTYRDHSLRSSAAPSGWTPTKESKIRPLSGDWEDSESEKREVPPDVVREEMASSR